VKNFLIITFLLLAVKIVLPQNNSSDNYVFGAGTVQYIKMFNTNCVVLGARGAWVIDQKYVLGFGIYNNITNIDKQIACYNNQSYKIGVNYGGLELGYIQRINQSIRFNFSMLLAGGGVYLNNTNPKGSPLSPYGLDYLVWQPEGTIETDITSLIHVSLGASYHLISSMVVNYYGISANDVKGLSGIFTIKIGTF
jgi:hypothetical protein